MVLASSQALTNIIQAVEYWPRTFHLVGQALVHIDRRHADGEGYCLADRFSTDQPGVGEDCVMYRADATSTTATDIARRVIQVPAMESPNPV